MTKNNRPVIDWIDVDDKLPGYDWKLDFKTVIFKCLVTVQLINSDPNDDPEVMTLQYWYGKKEWRRENCTLYRHGWKVTHWVYLPYAANHRMLDKD